MRLSYVNIIFVRAGMSELADEADSKSVDGNIVWVQVPLPALTFLQVPSSLKYFSKNFLRLIFFKFLNYLIQNTWQIHSQ